MDDDRLKICVDDAALYDDPQALVCRLPVHTERQAVDLLEGLATGGALGTGYAWNSLGIELPRIRGEYQRAVNELLQQVELRRSVMPIGELARWASAERLRIARAVRVRQGVGSVVLLEARDNWVYGRGGRTYANLARKYAKVVSGDAISERILTGAITENPKISTVAMRGARYLRYGGRVFIVVSVATTGYRLLTTPADDLARVLTEEGGGVAGGAIGAELAIGLCLGFGIVTGGWGLLACGVLGGVAGGAAGTVAGNRLYYAADDAITQAADTGVVDRGSLYETMPLGAY